MAVIDFPSTPVDGDVYEQDGASFTWTGQAWVLNKSQVPPVGPVVQIKRTPTNNNPPPPGLLEEGELAVEMGDPLRLWVGVPIAQDPSGKKLLAYRGAGDTWVDVTGDTMTGDLVIRKASPALVLDRLSGDAAVVGMLNGALRWVERLGDATAESGANAGSHYLLQAYNDAGAAIAPAILIGKRATNRLAVAGNPIDPLDIATKQYVDAGGAAGVPFDALAYSGLQVNGGFDVSQENGVGNVVTAASGKYVCDVWLVTASTGVGSLTNSQALIASNPGFNHALRMAVGVAFPYAAATDVVFAMQGIEGWRWQRLGFGTASAKSVTLAFWIMASVAGIASVAIRNAASNRSFISEFNVNAANVWEYKTITVPGCPDGVWEFGALVGANIMFCFGAGPAGAGSARGAAGAWANSALFCGNNVTNGFFGTVGFTVQLQGVTVLPGAAAPTAAQHPGIVRTHREEIVLVQRYFRPFRWTQEGHSGGAQARITVPHQIPEMRIAAAATRVSLTSSLNIRNGDTAQFVTCAASSESCIVTALESNAAGYTQAQGVVDNLSARF